MNSSARLGLILFGIYLLTYIVFVLMNALVPEMMEQTPLAGINVAILFGVGLILLAFVLSLFYGIFAGNSSATVTRTEGK